jgi:hypothetical protein
MNTPTAIFAGLAAVAIAIYGNGASRPLISTATASSLEDEHKERRPLRVFGKDQGVRARWPELMSWSRAKRTAEASLTVR